MTNQETMTELRTTVADSVGAYLVQLDIDYCMVDNVAAFFVTQDYIYQLVVLG